MSQDFSEIPHTVYCGLRIIYDITDTYLKNQVSPSCIFYRLLQRLSKKVSIEGRFSIRFIIFILLKAQNKFLQVSTIRAFFHLTMSSSIARYRLVADIITKPIWSGQSDGQI